MTLGGRRFKESSVGSSNLRKHLADKGTLHSSPGMCGQVYDEINPTAMGSNPIDPPPRSMCRELHHERCPTCYIHLMNLLFSQGHIQFWTGLQNEGALHFHDYCHAKPGSLLPSGKRGANALDATGESTASLSPVIRVILFFFLMQKKLDYFTLENNEFQVKGWPNKGWPRASRSPGPAPPLLLIVRA